MLSDAHIQEDNAKRAGATIAKPCAMRLRTILDQVHAFISAKLRNGVGGRESTVEMRQHDGAHALCDCGTECGDIDIAGDLVDIDENGRRAARDDRRCCVTAGIGHCRDRVGRADAKRPKHDLDRVGAVADTQRMPRPAPGGERRFETRALGAEHEGSRIEHVVERPAQLVSAGFVQSPQIDERNHRRLVGCNGGIGSVWLALRPHRCVGAACKGDRPCCAAPPGARAA